MFAFEIFGLKCCLFLDSLLKLSMTIYPQNLLSSDCITLYKHTDRHLEIRRGAPLLKSELKVLCLWFYVFWTAMTASVWKCMEHWNVCLVSFKFVGSLGEGVIGYNFEENIKFGM